MKLEINKIHMHFKENCSGKAKPLSPFSQYVAEIQSTAQMIFPPYHFFPHTNDLHIRPKLDKLPLAWVCSENEILIK